MVIDLLRLYHNLIEAKTSAIVAIFALFFYAEELIIRVTSCRVNLLGRDDLHVIIRSYCVSNLHLKAVVYLSRLIIVLIHLLLVRVILRYLRSLHFLDLIVEIYFAHRSQESAVFSMLRCCVRLTSRLLHFKFVRRTATDSDSKDLFLRWVRQFGFVHLKGSIATLESWSQIHIFGDDTTSQ